MLKKAEGIVIRSQDYGEGNKIVTLYTPEYGKISVMARGARKTKSRLSSIVQLFTYGHYLFFQSAPQKMGTLSQGETLVSFRDLRQDLVKMAYAAYFAELVNKTVEDGVPDPYLFQVLLMSCTYLADGKDPQILARLFELKILMTAGYKPQLDACVLCARTDNISGFSIREGGFLCGSCREADPQMMQAAPATLKLLRLFYHFDLDRLGEINVKQKTKHELREAIWSFMDYHTPLQLKSRTFLEQMALS